MIVINDAFIFFARNDTCISEQCQEFHFELLHYIFTNDNTSFQETSNASTNNTNLSATLPVLHTLIHLLLPEYGLYKQKFFP